MTMFIQLVSARSAEPKEPRSCNSSVFQPRARRAGVKSGLSHPKDVQGKNHQAQCQQGHQNHGAPAGGELALDDPLLGLEISVVAQEQHQDADAQEDRAERLAQVSQRVGVCAFRGARLARERRVEPEELCDGNADRGERQRRPQPGEKRPFCEVSASPLSAHTAEETAGDGVGERDQPKARWSLATEPLFSSSIEPNLASCVFHQAAASLLSS